MLYWPKLLNITQKNLPYLKCLKFVIILAPGFWSGWWRVYERDKGHHRRGPWILGWRRKPRNYFSGLNFTNIFFWKASLKQESRFFFIYNFFTKVIYNKNIKRLKFKQLQNNSFFASFSLVQGNRLIGEKPKNAKKCMKLLFLRHFLANLYFKNRMAQNCLSAHLLGAIGNLVYLVTLVKKHCSCT